MSPSWSTPQGSLPPNLAQLTSEQPSSPGLHTSLPAFTWPCGPLGIDFRLSLNSLGSTSLAGKASSHPLVTANRGGKNFRRFLRHMDSYLSFYHEQKAYTITDSVIIYKYDLAVDILEGKGITRRILMNSQSLCTLGTVISKSQFSFQL